MRPVIARSRASGLYGPGAEPVQGFLAGVSTIGASDRRTGLGVWAGRGGGVEILSRMSCSTACSLVISRVICSWPAESWSTLRVICSRLVVILAAMLTASSFRWSHVDGDSDPRCVLRAAQHRVGAASGGRGRLAAKAGRRSTCGPPRRPTPDLGYRGFVIRLKREGEMSGDLRVGFGSKAKSARG
jgi:hypothetical protein